MQRMTVGRARAVTVTSISGSTRHPAPRRIVNLRKEPPHARHVGAIHVTESLDEIFLFGLRACCQQTEDNDSKERNQPGSDHKCEAQGHKQDARVHWVSHEPVWAVI